MDRNGNGIGDMIERYADHPLFLDDRGTLPIIVDFDHDPTDADVSMLEDEVDLEHAFTLHLIHAVAGRMPVTELSNALHLPGVVMLELDGLLTTAMADVVPTHNVDSVWEDTGYTGLGATVAIIDTGIDGAHAGLDDMDDDNATDDPKVIAFYDPVNTPNLRNGTEVFPYDDQGHGTHCAGITAGTGAPDHEHIGVAPEPGSWASRSWMQVAPGASPWSWLAWNGPLRSVTCSTSAPHRCRSVGQVSSNGPPRRRTV